MTIIERMITLQLQSSCLKIFQNRVLTHEHLIINFHLKDIAQIVFKVNQFICL